MNDTPNPQFVNVAPGGGDQSWMDRNRITLKANTEQTAGAYGLITSAAPKDSSPPLHIHHCTDEGIWVLSGRLRIVCGDQDFEITTGSFTLLPRGIPHSFLALEDSVMLAIMSPGGEEPFFFDGGQPVTSDVPPPLDVPKMAAVGDRYKIEVVGPPLQPTR